MALNIKDPVTEELAADVARLTGENKTRAIRVALAERKARLEMAGATAATPGIRQLLEDEIWPLVPPAELGRRLTREEEDAILGYGSDGL